MTHLSIEKVIGRKIIDFRDNPAAGAEVTLSNGLVGRGTAPSDASIGEFETIELRDSDRSRFDGKGVGEAVGNTNTVINEVLRSLNLQNAYAVDAAMLVADGTKNESKLDVNAILAVPTASTKTVAESLGIPLYRFLGGTNGNNLLAPMMNILSGGIHATNSVGTQEFMIMPVGASSFFEGFCQCTEAFYSFQKILKSEGNMIAVGDESGFASNLKDDEGTIEHVPAVARNADYEPGKDFALAMDATSSGWKSDRGIGFYHQPRSGRGFALEELITYWKSLIEKYPVQSVEDGLGEEDWEGWKEMTKELGDKVWLVSDDLLVTNTKRPKKGIELDRGNPTLIKLNQIDSVSETLEIVEIAHKAGYTVITSHRSGETEDTTIADFAVALNTRQTKIGTPSRSECIVKYNQLLRIESDLGVAAEYPGKDVFNRQSHGKIKTGCQREISE